MAVTVTHSKTLIAPDSGVEDKVYGSDYVSPDSHTVEGLGSAAETEASDYATAAQGATADAAQPGDPQLTAIAGLGYAGNALKTIRVTAGEDGFELATASADVAWGAITGTLADQTDLQGELDAISSKAAIITLSSAAYTLSSLYAISTHFHSASVVTSSTFALARLASGTTNVSTFLNGTSSWTVPVYGHLSGLPTLGTAASTAAANYASSTHSISSATHTFPGGSAEFLRADGVFAAPPAGSSNLSTIKQTVLQFSTTTSTLPLTSLAFTVSNTICYTFDFGILYASAISSTGLKVGMTFPTVSSFGATIRIPMAAAGVAGEFQGYIVSSGSFITATATPLASTKYYANIFGALLPTANGTMQVTFGTEVAGSAISTFAGSYGVLTTL